jgi:hypothetical protein
MPSSKGAGTIRNQIQKSTLILQNGTRLGKDRFARLVLVIRLDLVYHTHNRLKLQIFTERIPASSGARSGGPL